MPNNQDFGPRPPPMTLTLFRKNTPLNLTIFSDSIAMETFTGLVTA